MVNIIYLFVMDHLLNSFVFKKNLSHLARNFLKVESSRKRSRLFCRRNSSCFVLLEFMYEFYHDQYLVSIPWQQYLYSYLMSKYEKSVLRIITMKILNISKNFAILHLKILFVHESPLISFLLSSDPRE